MTEKEKRIGDMEIGESGWTMSWAVRLGLKNDYYIDKDLPLVAEQGGTYQLKVTREQDGYHAKLHIPFRFEPERLPYRWRLLKKLVRLRNFERPT